MASAFLLPRRKNRFLPPRPPQGDLERPHLLETLQKNIFRKLNLVCAAPGYGKTTLAAQFSRSVDFPVAWLQLEEGDRDPAVFCEDILYAFQTTLPEWNPPMLSQLGLPASVEKPAMLGAALAEALDQTLSDFTVLVLDDFHLVDDSRPILEVVDSLLVEMPAALHILLLSRHVPALRVTPLVASQEAAGFSEDHLRLSPAEVQELVAGRNKISLPTAEAENLASSNEGWVTGILLSTHLLWKGLPLGGGVTGREQVFHFLATEVLEQQPAHLRTFMRDASVLLDMEAAACDYVLDRTDGADMLSQLDTRRLFVFSSGEDQPVYRFHNLFREFLLSRLQQRESARYATLLERAAEWNLKNGLPEIAFSYFIQAENYGRAIQLAESNVQRLYESGRFQTLLAWAKRLDPVRLEVPRLYGCVAMALGMSGEFPIAEEWLEIARKGLERTGNTARLHSLAVSRIWLAYRKGAYAEGLALAEKLLRRAKEKGDVDKADWRMAANHAGLCAGALGRPADAVRYLREAEAAFPEKEKSYDHAHVMTYLANALQAAGETSKAYLLQRRSLSIWRDLGYPGPIAITLNNIAYDQHMMGQLTEAEATYTEAMEWSRKSGDRHSQLLIFSGQGDLKMDQGQYAAAAGYLTAALGLAENIDDIAMQRYIFRGMAELNRKMANYPAAMEWMRRAASLLAPESGPSAAEDILCGAMLEEKGNRKEALAVLEKAVRELEAGKSSPFLLARGLFLLARSRFRAGNSGAAEHALQQAFDLVFGLGSDQILIREAACSKDLLDAFVSHPQMGGLCVSLMERAKRQIAPTQKEPAGPVSPEPPALSVHALGELRIQWNGREVPRSAWVSQKTKEVLLYLVDRTPASREGLLKVFWPDMPAGRGQANLYQTLYRIRRAVSADILILKDQVCRLADTIVLNYDVTRFEESARHALALPVTSRERASEMEKALGFFHGEYLEDVPVDWASRRREEINQLFLLLIREQCDDLVGLCKYEAAKSWLARGLELDPYRDEMHQRMLKVLAATGRKHEMIDHYQKYILLLRQDLGLDPPPETRSLYSRLIS